MADKAWAVWSREYGYPGNSAQMTVVERMLAVCKTRDGAVAEAMRIVAETAHGRSTCVPLFEQPAVMIREAADLVGF